jgi:hypothetical protein
MSSLFRPSKARWIETNFSVEIDSIYRAKLPPVAE